MKLKPEVKARWVTALRSGDYEQGKGALASKSEDGHIAYCCLGVLCEIAVADKIIEPKILDEGADVFHYGYSTGGLPTAVSEWATISSDDMAFLTRVSVDKRTIGLAGLNDHRDWDFNQIADIIEEQL